VYKTLRYHTNIFIRHTDSVSQDESNYRCLRDLRVTDPRHDRTRILKSKDELLEGSCSWVLDDPAFCRWWEDDNTRIFWIHGDPGKGKTMMTMALIDEISERLQSAPYNSWTLAYFFCQTEERLNNAVAVVRSLIYLLVEQQRALAQHVRRHYEIVGATLFEGGNALYALWAILLDILKDSSLPRIYLLIDAFDECTVQQIELLELITGKDMASLPKVKWLVTSRNESAIQERLEHGDRRVHTSLEMNSQHVSNAVLRFIDVKVQQLVQTKKYDLRRQSFVGEYLRNRAEGTFLWVALVCQELQRVPSRKTESVLQSFPAGLKSLYARMVAQISSLSDPEDISLCFSILRAITITVRPLHLSELALVAGLPDEMHGDLASAEELVSQCGSFLTLRDMVVSFIHQSARDFVSQSSSIFSSGQPREHGAIWHRCRELMSRTLRKDICDLRAPGIVIGEIEPGRVARCLSAPAQYACCYWVNHLLHSRGCGAGSVIPRDKEEMQAFFNRAFLHWVEALSLIDKISEGIAMVTELESVIQVSSRPSRFMHIHYGKDREMLMYRCLA